MSGVLDAAQSGDEVAALEAMRDTLAEAMDLAPPAVIAQVAARLQAVLERLSELKPSKGVTLDDALAARRDARAAKPDAARPAARKTKPAS